MLCGTPILRRFQHTFISLRCRLQRCIRMVGAAITVFSAPVRLFSIRMASGQETQTVMVFTRSIQIRLKVSGRRCETSFVPFVAFIKSSSPVTSQSVIMNLKTVSVDFIAKLVKSTYSLHERSFFIIVIKNSCPYKFASRNHIVPFTNLRISTFDPKYH